MTDKIKIGENEYTAPFCQDNYDSDWFIDAENNMLDNDDIVVALNELATLRDENAGLRKEIQEAVEIIKDYQHVCEEEWGADDSDADCDSFKWLQRNKPKEGE